MPVGPSSEAVAAALLRNGFSFVHQRRSHAKYRKVGQPALTVIEPTGRKNLAIGTFRSICRQAGLDHKDF